MALKTKDFSVTGVSSGGGITYTYILRVTENSTNTAANTSNVTVQAILKQSYSGTAFYSWYTGVSCTINGSQIFSDYRQRRLDGTAEHVYYTWTGDIAHNADGSLALSVGGKLWQSSYASYSPPAMTITESAANAMVLTTIPRASTVTAADANIGAAATVIVGRSSAAFTHTITYSFGSLSGYIGTDGSPVSDAVKLSAETVGFRLPESFYAQIPNAKYGVCTLTCQTWSGDTKIGDAASCTFRAYAPESDCAPTVTGEVVDINEKTYLLTGDQNTLVRYMSDALCSITAQARNGASIEERRIGGIAVPEDTRLIEQAEQGSFLFRAKDSRGYESTCTVQKPMIPYVKLTCNPSAKRTDPTSGNAILTVAGNYYSGSFGKADNALTLRYRVGSGDYVEITPTVDDAGYVFTAELTGLDYQGSHSIDVEVCDKLETVTRTVTLGKGIPVFDWGENDFCFHVPVDMPALRIAGKKLEEYIQTIIQGG